MARGGGTSATSRSTNSSRLSSKAVVPSATDGFLVVDRGTNSIVTARTYIGPTPEDEALIGWNEGTVPVPAGWSWRVEVGNAAWADLRVTWVPLEPAAE